MKRITRDQRLISEEAAKYNGIREQVAEELPDLIARHHTADTVQGRSTLPTETEIHDVRIVEIGTNITGWAGLYIDGKLDCTDFAIKPRNIAQTARGRPITVKLGRMRMSDDDLDNGFRFPEDISELDKRKKNFRIKWDD